MVKRIIALVALVTIICCGCSKQTQLLDSTIKISQKGAYFPEGEDRFVLVDQSVQSIGGMKYTCRVFADKYMLTMYLWMSEFSGSGRGSLTQIFYEDGSPMIYDPTEEEWEEWGNKTLN